MREVRDVMLKTRDRVLKTRVVIGGGVFLGGYEEEKEEERGG